MEIKIIVPAKIIAALKPFAANQDLRFYLNGIALEIGREESRLIASDGHRLAAYRLQCGQLNVDDVINIIVPNVLLKEIKPSSGDIEIVIGSPVSPDSNARPIGLTVGFGGPTITGKTIDDKYPDWRRVVPSEVSGESSQLRPHLLADLPKIYATLHGTKIKDDFPILIGHNGSKAALVSLNDENFLCVVIPMYEDRSGVPTKPPAWLSDCLHKSGSTSDAAGLA